jgi:hypothetical protein
METVEIIGSTMGLGFVAGTRLYAAVLVLGLLIKYGHFPTERFGEPLAILGSWPVIIVAFLAYAIEFTADKIPWVNSLWDVFHSLIRPVGAATLAASVIGPVDLGLKIILILLCGGVAIASHTSKLSSRLVLNHSPEPFTRVAASLLEDLLALLGLYISMVHPLVALAGVVAFLIAFAWIAPRIYRSVRLQWVAARQWMHSKRAIIQGSVDLALPPECSGLQVIAKEADWISPAYERALQRESGLDTAMLGVRAAAAASIGGLRNSVGFLVICDKELAFVARRRFRFVVHRIRLSEVVSTKTCSGLLMNRLQLRTQKGQRDFYLFKSRKSQEVRATSAERAAAEVSG